MMHQAQPNASLDLSPVALLYQRHAATVLTYIRPRVASKEDAEDVLLEVFLVVLQNQTPLNLSESEQQRWLRHVARNKIIDRYRQHSRRPAIASLDEVVETLFADDADAPDVRILRDAEYGELLAHLADLPRMQQEILHLRFFRDLSTKEIAQQLKKSDASIRTMLSRTLNHLRGIYEPHKGGK